MKKLILLLLFSLPCFLYAQQTIEIKGRILDRADGLPIIGATIFIDPNDSANKNYSPQGTMSDVDGYFVFKLPISVKTVIVSCMGYESLKLDISNQKEYIVRLSQNSLVLDDVVVTGYQNIEKRKLTSSIVKVDMKQINRVGVSSVDQMLEGQLAGVYTSSTSGAPGAVSKTRIRSAVTINGTDDPLWVLDGMPLEGNEIPSNWTDKDNIDNLRTMSIAGMNPDDIADITVLKDAAATAIYGARAANGVIIITSKKGARKQPMRINVSAATFITEKPQSDKLNLMNASEKVDFELLLAANKNLDFQKGMGAVARILDLNGGADRDNLINGRALSKEGLEAINKLRSSGINWFDEIYRRSINQQYSVGVSGGGDRTAYYFSAGYYNEEGTTKGTSFERFNLTLKTDFHITNNLKFGAALFGTVTDNSSYITDANGFSNPANYTRRVNPYLNVYNSDGSYLYDPDMVAYQKNNDETLPFNFIEESTNTKYNLNNRAFKSLFDIEYKPIKELKLYTQLGLQLENSTMERFADKETYFVRKYHKDKTSEVLDIPLGGVIKNADGDIFQYNWKLQAEFSKNFNNKHEFDFMAGLELRANTNESITTQAFGYDPKNLTSKPIIFDNTDAGQRAALSSKYRLYQKSFTENRFTSYFITSSYTYKRKYTLFGSMRYDGTNIFGVDKEYRFTPLWSLSGAWTIKNEEWMKNVDWISNLKLRASYGVQGNIDKNTSPYVIGVWGTTNIGGVYEPIIDASLPNRYLRWETTKTWNVGLELGFFDSRLNMMVEAYHRVSDNLITPELLPQENGFSYTSSNFGKMTGKGLELSINSVNVVTKDFRWSTSFNISTVKTIINKINFEQDPFAPSRQGYSPTAIFGYKIAGLDENGLPLILNSDGKAVSMKEHFGGYVNDLGWGDYYYSFENSADKIKASQTYLGDGAPKFTGGLINTFNYKGFDLTISGNFVINQLVMAQPFYNPVATNPGLNISKEALNIWREDNKNSNYPTILPMGNSMISGAEPTDAQFASAIFDGVSTDIFSKFDIWMRNMSYFRINSIRLGYSLPSTFVNKLKLSQVRVSVETRNPFVISTNYKGYFDPENYGNIYAQPLARTISFGLNISF